MRKKCLKKTTESTVFSTAFNNPGSGRNRVATDIIDGSDRSMKAHAIRQEASYTDEYGQDHTGPKYQPGRVRKERWLAQHGKASVRLQVLKVKTDPPALVALRFAKEGRGWHLYTTSRLPEGTMFRAHGGGFGDQTIYIAEGSLWDYLKEALENLAGEMMFYDWPDFQQIEVDEGWVVRGERIDEKLLQRVIYTLGARHRIESP